MSMHHSIRPLGIVLGGILATHAQAQVTYSRFRFEPVELHASGTTVQLSEFVFSNGGTRLNLVAANPEIDPPVNGQDGSPENTVPVVVTGGSRAVNDAEGAIRIIDGALNTKWLSGINENGGEARNLYFDFAAPVTVDSYSFATGGDTAVYPNRNPVSWRMWGRNSEEEEWTLIDRVTGHPTVPTSSTFEEDFPLTGKIAPQIHSFGVSYGAPVIVKNGESTRLDWDAYDEFVPGLDSVTLSPSPGSAVYTEREFDVAVVPPADSDTVYTLTATADGMSSARELTLRSVAGGSATHRFFRFTPVATRRSVDGHQLSEFAFFRDGNELNLFATNNPSQITGSRGDDDDRLDLVVTNPGGAPAADAAEGAVRLVDGDTATKLFDIRRMPVVFEFGEPVTIDAYRFTTANDNDGRDPVRWTLEGSDDGESWTLIDNVTAFVYPTTPDRQAESQVFPLPGSSLDPDVVGAPVFVWNGSLNTNYDTSYNWSTGVAPGLTDEVEIASGTAIRGGNLERVGRTTIAGDATLTVNGRLLNRGDFRVQGGSVVQNGNYFIVGINQPGAIDHSAGAVTANHDRGFFLSDNGGAAGSRYRLSGTGVLAVNSSGNGNTSVGGSGLHNVHLGKGGENDAFEMIGGEATFTSTNNNFVYLSRASAMRITGGSATFKDYTAFLIGFEGTGNNRFEISGGEVFFMNTPLLVGGGSTGFVELTGGNLTLSGSVALGQSTANGTFTMTGGSLRAADIVSTVRGSFVFEGGEIVLDGDRRALVGEAWFAGAEGTTATYDAEADLTRIAVEGGTGDHPFDLWAAASGIPSDRRGPDDDPDGDGVGNLVEFALGGLPGDASSRGVSAALPADGGAVITLAARKGAEFSPDGDRLVATVDGVRYEIQGSLDLLSWEATVEAVVPAVTGTLSPPGDDWELHSFRVRRDVESGAGGRGFLRVEVSEIP